jgi:tetratricopeptide (TPR) repeat protein
MMPSQPQQPSAPTPQQVFDQARRLLSLGDFHEAAQRAALLRSQFGQQVPMLALHGFAMSAVGMHEVAVKDLGAAVGATERALAERDAEDANRPRLADQLMRLSVQAARSWEALGDRAEADASLSRALKIDPEDPEATRARVEILAGRGEVAEARRELDQANELGLEELPSAMSAGAVALARSDTGGEEFRVLAQRIRALTEVVGLDAATQGDALRRCGALFDRAGAVDDAFRAFTRAANLKRGSFDAAAHAKVTNAVIAGWTAEAMGKVRSPASDGAPGPVFVVSLPGSGGEDLGRAMARAGAGGTGGAASLGPSELLTVAAVRHAGARPTPYRPALASPSGLRGAQLSEVAAFYRSQAVRHAWAPGAVDGSSVFVDASSLHGHLIGLAAMALPGARFVLLRRDLREATLACYFGAMCGHYPFSRDLATTASFLRDADRLMDHWAGVLAAMGRTVVSAERAALASDPGGETRRIMGELGLEVGSVDGPRLVGGAWAHPERYARRLEGLEGFFGQRTAGSGVGG